MNNIIIVVCVMKNKNIIYTTIIFGRTTMKKVRMLLRVSSNQQLDADGDLSVQRKIVIEYIEQNKDWFLDKKEYFEGSNSGYSNSVAERDILQEILDDATKREFDILVAYKDDRIGRRMWEIGAYVMELKKYNVDIYTVKDGCISPESDDIMGQMVLALRYGNAQKSSSDTGMRVKDTAQKLVQQGRFIGGKAPYGYKLVLSGELSKHGRALHKLVVIPEQAEVVKHIYDLSFNFEYGSSKIAKILNEDVQFRKLAPNDLWKSGTITSILTNPIYCGITAYKRREKKDGKHRRLDSNDWIYANKVNNEISIISVEKWNLVQERRKSRSEKYKSTLKEKGVNVIKRNDGMLTLIDVAYCGYCGKKLTNGSKYNYWTIKETGEKRASKIPIYKCQTAQQGMPHNKVKQFKADKIEETVFEYISEYINSLQDKQDIFNKIMSNNENEKKVIEQKINKIKQDIKKQKEKIDVMKEHIPDAITGDYPLSLELLSDTIAKFEEGLKKLNEELKETEKQYDSVQINQDEWENTKNMIISWKDVFTSADKAKKRVLINQLVEKIIIKEDEILIKFRVNLDFFLAGKPRMNSGFGTTKPSLIHGYRSTRLEDVMIKL